MNEVKLQESHPVDENLRPLKVDERSTSLELATDNARVSGDLEVTGDIYGSIDKMYFGNNPAYYGALIGYTKIRNDLASIGYDTIQITNSMTVLQTAQGTDVSITFIAPPSGCVEITLNCMVYSSSREVTFSLSDSSSYNEYEPTFVYTAHGMKPDETDYVSAVIPFSLRALTSGTSYTFYIAAKTSTNYSFIYHGVNRSDEYTQPILIKAIALPPQSVMTIGE